MRTITVFGLAGALALGACGTTASPAVSPSPTGPTAGEVVLLAGARLDLQGRCTPLRTDLAETVVAAIDCRPADPDVHRVTLFLFDTQKDLLDTYLGQLAALGIRPRTDGDCAAGRPSEWSYIPGDSGATLNPERESCYVDATRLAHDMATLPPFVLAQVDGNGLETGAVQRFAWLGNQDTPGGPTIWNSGGPMSPEK